MKYFLLLAFLITVVIMVKAVDRSKFRRCVDTGFCRRYRGRSTPPPTEQVDAIVNHDNNDLICLHIVCLGSILRKTIERQQDHWSSHRRLDAKACHP